MNLDFGPHFGYLAVAYLFVILSIGGYGWSLRLRTRELDRREQARGDGD